MAVTTKRTKQLTWQDCGNWIARALDIQPSELRSFCENKIRADQAAAASPAASPAAARNATRKRGRKSAMATA